MSKTHQTPSNEKPTNGNLASNHRRGQLSVNVHSLSTTFHSWHISYYKLRHQRIQRKNCEITVGAYLQRKLDSCASLRFADIDGTVGQETKQRPVKCPSQICRTVCHRWMFRAAADQEQFHKLLTSQVKGCHCLWRRHGPEDTHVIRILPHPRVQLLASLLALLAGLLFFCVYRRRRRCSISRRPHLCQCVCYYEGTLKQFNAPSARTLKTIDTW